MTLREFARLVRTPWYSQYAYCSGPPRMIDLEERMNTKRSETPARFIPNHPKPALSKPRYDVLEVRNSADSNAAVRIDSSIFERTNCRTRRSEFNILVTEMFERFVSASNRSVPRDVTSIPGDENTVQTKTVTAMHAMQP